jgi:ribosome-binding factor A
MELSKRQIQVGKLIQTTLTDIFQKQGISIFNNGMITISNVIVTPDLLEARIYLSFFQIQDATATMDALKDRLGEIRGMLGNKLRNQLRRIPVITLYNDDTLDHVFKMEALFKQIEEERLNRENPSA